MIAKTGNQEVTNVFHLSFRRLSVGIEAMSPVQELHLIPFQGSGYSVDIFEPPDHDHPTAHMQSSGSDTHVPNSYPERGCGCRGQ